MKTNRREFLEHVAQAGAVVSLAPTLPSLFCKAAAGEADPSGDSVLVVVQLSGGNDGLNTVVPCEDDAYYRNRFTLAVGKGTVRKIDDHVGFHPAMEEMSELFQEGKLAVVQGVGYPNPNRSHFESMDLWHTAHQPATARRTGWIGRGLDAALDQETDLPAVHFGAEKQPLALAAERVQVPSLSSLGEFRLDARKDGQLAEQIRKLVSLERDGENRLLQFVQDSSAAALQASQRLERSEGRLKSAANYPGTDLGRKLQAVAQLIRAAMPTRVYYVTLDGFDTHANQADAHSGLLNQLSSAVAAFQDDLAKDKLDRRVLLMAFSEFGRRLKENASRGTDHGAAAPLLLVGGKVQGGVVGPHPSLTDLENGDPKFHTDYRRIYATVLEDWLGWRSEGVLGGKFRKLPLCQA